MYTVLCSECALHNLLFGYVTSLIVTIKDRSTSCVCNIKTSNCVNIFHDTPATDTCQSTGDDIINDMTLENCSNLCQFIAYEHSFFEILPDIERTSHDYAKTNCKSKSLSNQMR